MGDEKFWQCRATTEIRAACKSTHQKFEYCTQLINENLTEYNTFDYLS
jgi:hypothetical protein